MLQDSVQSVPLIDLDRWRHGDASERTSVINEVDQHLQQVGFLMVINHGIPPEVRDAARQAAKSFFALSSGQKQAYSCPPNAYRGWIAPGLESNASSYDVNENADKEKALVLDLKEAFSVGPDFEGIDDYRDKAPRWYADNIWPTKEVTGFQEALTAWWNAADTLTIELLDIMCRAIGFDQAWIDKHCLHPMATVTANLYPAVIEEGGWRVGAHTDFGTITVLDRDTDNGLQVEVEPGRWIDAPQLDNAVTINLGEMMVLLTAGRWRANPHRVAAKLNAADNLSLVYFHDPDYDLVLPQKREDGTNITAADFLKIKMDQIIQG
jgi:isopenicillin N synthase-like dioxygenase